jgi:hypothetical protein
MRRAFFIALSLVICSAGCSSNAHHAAREHGLVVHGLPSGVPRPPFGRIIAASYRARRVSYVHLTGQAVPDVVVTSVGPPTGSLGFHSANVQVLSWDSVAQRWAVVFDGQKTQPPDQLVSPANSNLGVTANVFGGDDEPPPLLDPAANVTLGRIRFARMLPGKGAQLIFSSFANYGGSGLPGNLVMVDFKGGLADLVYFWSGDGGVRYRLLDTSPFPRIRARASYWTQADAHCCPVRSYTFTVGRGTDGSVEELSDERPWLGAIVEPVDENNNESALAVLDIVPGSPAASHLQKGDVISAITNTPRPAGQFIGQVLYDQFAKLDAGDVVRLRVVRDGSARAVAITLGSLADGSVENAVVPNDFTIVAL